ncbi:glycosyltransferase family 4 protein [Cellulomonas rhizosphaerae]|uniref:Glycosyltransferase n=1 Tax=Cellulomonas rhizosphaerae TaxID=2293719 RepID=A0A413RQI9_9CELL|nr:glycosyltransferase family 4 protein [Cellulomonas rhizosphaerae]RHA44217.1 glycosyltransferase [Cellulomonas rhizosphaerae]
MTRDERWLVATSEYAGLTAYTGGIGTHYAGLLPALVRAGAQVDLLMVGAEELVAESVPGGVVLLDARSRPHRIVTIPDRHVLARAARAGGYDRIFAPEWGAIASSLPRGAPLLTNLATSTSLQNEVAGLSPASFGWRRGAVQVVRSAREHRQIRRSAGVVAISRAMVERSQRLLGRLPPARVVPNTVDIEQVRLLSRASRPPAWWPSSGPVILFVGRLERRKGVLEAMAAFASVSAHHPAAHLVLAGSSGDRRFEPDRAGLLDLVPVGARDRVHLVGHLPAEHLHPCVRAATAVMCPSLWEGFGNAALEAKAVGAAVVVTRGSGFDDFCTDDDDCLMVSPGDAADLARALIRLLDDRALRLRLGQAAARSADAYAPDRVAPLLLRAADELLGPVTPGRRVATSSRPT